MDEREITFEPDDEEFDNEHPDQQLWAHETLNEFEALIDSVGVESVMFLMQKEHEDILRHWVKEGVDIQSRTKQ
jgi:hypothetical protein